MNIQEQHVYNTIQFITNKMCIKHQISDVEYITLKGIRKEFQNKFLQSEADKAIKFYENNIGIIKLIKTV
jgi:hypothetical protein